MSLKNEILFKQIIFFTAVFVAGLFTSCDRVGPASDMATASMLDSSDSIAPESVLKHEHSVSTTQRTAAIDESRQNAITNAVNAVSPAVVNITVTEVIQGKKLGIVGQGFYTRFGIIPFERDIKSIGSGFIISEDGLIVTNAHVANENAKKIIVTLSDGSQYEAELIGADRLSDIALLKVEADEGLPYIQFANSENVIVGEWAIAIGNPFGLFNAARPSVTVGVVSAVHRDFRPNPREPRVYLDMIQTDASINQGNSGGPLVNSAGEVIGINTFYYSGETGRGFVGLGFAIPSNRAKKIIQELAEDGEFEKQFDLGMEMRPTTYRFALNNRIAILPGLFVTSVNRDGPAFESGIIPGDIILKIGDTSVQSRMHAQAILREYQVGDSLRIEFTRDGQRFETKVYLRGSVSGD